MSLKRLAKNCAADQPLLKSIQQGTMSYQYKGVPTYKSPFDLALYQMLLWEQKPRTLIEIGSKFGGSALWFADQLRSFGVDYAIHSVDVAPPKEPPIIPGVVFHRGDAHNLLGALTSSLLENLPRPIMVVEDSSHRSVTTLAVLRFFDSWLRPGEYIVIEDGIIDDLFAPDVAARYEGGPRRAIGDFLAERGTDYEIDARLCDFFGQNMTWNVNGYLRRTR